MDYRTAGLDGRICILYGHNMMDGSMFKELMNFRDSSFAKAHIPFITEFTFGEYGFEDDDSYQEWLNTVAGKSTFKFDNKLPGINDKVILCSTCVDNYGNRQIVCIYRGEEVVD